MTVLGPVRSIDPISRDDAPSYRRRRPPGIARSAGFRRTPDRIVVPGAVLLVGARTIDDPSPEWLLAALGAGLVLFAIVFVYPKGMGMGDVKLAALLGAGLGVSVVVALFIGFLAAFVPALVLIVLYGGSARKRAISLGPFLALGGIVAL